LVVQQLGTSAAREVSPLRLRLDDDTSLINVNSAIALSVI
jgi:hypothetical protein